jgi:hypothetical protein
MVLHVQIVNSLQEYFNTANVASLRDLIPVIEAEIANPSIQSAVAVIPMTMEEIARVFHETEGSIKLAMAHVEVTENPIVENKLLRTYFANDTGYCLFRVDYVDDSVLKLSKVEGFEMVPLE